MTTKTTGTLVTPTVHREGEDNKRHWSAGSQPYAPADVLQHYIEDGWKLNRTAAIETFFYAGYRRVDVYYFTLRRESEAVEMPVLSNPVVRRLVEDHKLTVLRLNAGIEE